jgi:hypothetical protein
VKKRKFRVGDRVKVIGYSPAFYPPGIKDELGTEKLFKSMVGRIYTIRGFDKYGHAELQPTHSDKVWIEPELLQLRTKRKGRR